MACCLLSGGVDGHESREGRSNRGVRVVLSAILRSATGVGADRVVVNLFLIALPFGMNAFCRPSDLCCVRIRLARQATA